MKICHHSKAAYQIGWAAGMFHFRYRPASSRSKHKKTNFLVVWTFLILAKSVMLLCSHSCVWIYSGCVTAMVQPISPLSRNGFSSADVCESQWVLANNCVHLSQVLHQPSVVIECSTPLYSVLICSPLTHNLHMMLLINGMHEVVVEESMKQQSNL